MFFLLLLMVALSWLTKNLASFNGVMSSGCVTLRMIQLPLARLLLTLVVCGDEGRILGIAVRGKSMLILPSLRTIGFTNLKV
jgi:hypothetical protein